MRIFLFQIYVKYFYLDLTTVRLYSDCESYEYSFSVNPTLTFVLYISEIDSFQNRKIKKKRKRTIFNFIRDNPIKSNYGRYFYGR